MPLSIFAMMDSVMIRGGALWQVPARSEVQPRAGALRMADPGLNGQFKVNAATELTLLGLAAATAGGVAWANDYFVFSIILMALGGIALGLAASR
jgi:hypothetical protein